MKKSILAGLIFGILLFSMIGFVSAASELSASVQNFLDKIIDVATPILNYTLGNVEQGNSVILFVKFLAFLIMLSAVYLAARKTPLINEHKVVLWVITIAIAILGARYLTIKQLVEFVWLPSGLVSIALASLLPFILFFFFIESFNNSRVIRRVGWAFFAVLYITLAFYRWSELAPGASKIPFNLGWVYIFTAVLSLLAIVFDKRIRAGLMHYWMSEIAESGKSQHLTLINDQIGWLQSVLAQPVGGGFPGWHYPGPQPIPSPPAVHGRPLVRASDHDAAKNKIKALRKSIEALMTT